MVLGANEFFQARSTNTFFDGIHAPGNTPMLLQDDTPFFRTGYAGIEKITLEHVFRMLRKHYTDVFELGALALMDTDTV